MFTRLREICESVVNFLAAQVEIPFSVDGHEVIIHQVIDEVNGLAGGFHFRS